MRRSFEQIQKIIIVSALTLGLLISAGGVSYKYLFAKEHKGATTQNASDLASTSLSVNLYTKLQLSQPINIAVLGSSGATSKEQQKKLVNKLSTEFSCKVSLFSLASIDGSSWSTLMTLNNFISTKPEMPDLIILYPSASDQSDISIDDVKPISDFDRYLSWQRINNSSLTSDQAHRVGPGKLPIQWNEDYLAWF
ncbi:hypothetical protein [Desulfotomaculum sp. 1211_IL3151]|uniref:hypothetical protein n=1 Tax=Desulfotomaculum sp. 1211_IL3151 TaxID=3084055 RepID=UPI002FDB54A2